MIWQLREGDPILGGDGALRYYARGTFPGDDGPPIHRDDGPAIIYDDGAESWYRYGELHRVDGPAYIDECGYKEWWLFGVHYEPMEWMIKVHELE